jgi:hypothetical protein
MLKDIIGSKWKWVVFEQWDTRQQWKNGILRSDKSSYVSFRKPIASARDLGG